MIPRKIKKQMIMFRMADLCSLSIGDRMRLMDIINKPLPKDKELFYEHVEYEMLVRLFWDDEDMYFDAFAKCIFWVERIEKIMQN